jgi:hypothetical protein
VKQEFGIFVYVRRVSAHGVIKRYLGPFAILRFPNL